MSYDRIESLREKISEISTLIRKVKELNENYKRQISMEKEELKKVGTSSEVKITPMIEEVSSGREIADVYLKHPGNESSEDEEGTEERVVATGDDEKEEYDFQTFVKKHKEKVGANK